jgi:hypothetical protein
MRRVPVAWLPSQKRKPAREAALSARNAIPLSLILSGLVANCGVHLAPTDCGGSYAINKNVLATASEFVHFAHDDNILDAFECLELCQCLAPNARGLPAPQDAGTRLDAGADALDGDVDALDPDADALDAHMFARDGDNDPGTGGTGGTSGTGGGPIDGGGMCVPASRSYLTKFTSCAYHGATATGHSVQCIGWEDDGRVCGRDGACHLHLGRGRGRSAVARWLAFAAATEAASIRSFLTLRRELRTLGAPAHFVRRAHRAARDEARHTRSMLRLARDRGGEVEWPHSVHLPPRDLEAVATENAIEGCVHETWAALLNHHQAAYAADLEVRAVMARIATDEAAHAELAFDIDCWAAGALPRAARARVQRAKQAAGRALGAALRESAPTLRAALGLPGRGALHFYARELERRLWS